jgi:hypothetical protein
MLLAGIGDAIGGMLAGYVGAMVRSAVVRGHSEADRLDSRTLHGVGRPVYLPPHEAPVSPITIIVWENTPCRIGKAAAYAGRCVTC